jgi:hypothetical protein
MSIITFDILAPTKSVLEDSQGFDHSLLMVQEQGQTMID